MPHHFWLKHIETISSYNMLLDLLPATPSETASMTLPITNGSLYSLSKKHRTWNPRNEEIDLNSANAKLIPGKVLAKHMVISGVFLVTFWGPKNDDWPVRRSPRRLSTGGTRWLGWSPGWSWVPWNEFRGCLVYTGWSYKMLQVEFL